MRPSGTHQRHLPSALQRLFSRQENIPWTTQQLRCWRIRHATHWYWWSFNYPMLERMTCMKRTATPTSSSYNTLIDMIMAVDVLDDLSNTMLLLHVTDGSFWLWDTRFWSTHCVLRALRHASINSLDSSTSFLLHNTDHSQYTTPGDIQHWYNIDTDFGDAKHHLRKK